MAKRMSLSFKVREEFLYDYVQEQLDPLYYIKNLILQDMKKNDESFSGMKKEDKSSKVEEKIIESNDSDFEIIFD